MELPAIIQRVPLGLLRLLGIQNTGQNPSALAGFVQPTMELWQLYAAERMRSTTAVGNAIAANGTFDATPATIANVTVPASEFWYVDDCNWEVGLGGATTFQAQGAWNIPNAGGNVRHYWSDPLQAPVVAGTSYFLSTMNGRPFLLPPGSVPQLQVSAFAGAAGSWLLRMRYLPLQF